MDRKILLGATEDGTIVFAKVEIRERNGERIFSVSFDEVRPVVVTEEYMRERAEEILDGLDRGSLYDLCKRFDCRPSELVDYFMHDQLENFGVEGIIDISLYPESFSVDDYEDEIYFESVSCGQNDTRDILIPIYPEFSEWLHSLWESYHLQQLPEEYGNIEM